MCGFLSDIRAGLRRSFDRSRPSHVGNGHYWLTEPKCAPDNSCQDSGDSVAGNAGNPPDWIHAVRQGVTERDPPAPGSRVTEIMGRRQQLIADLEKANADIEAWSTGITGE